MEFLNISLPKRVWTAEGFGEILSIHLEDSRAFLERRQGDLGTHLKLEVA